MNNAIIDSLQNRINNLDEENQELISDIEKISKSGKGGALEYYTNIRKEIFYKIEDLNKQINSFTKNSMSENKKLNKELNSLNEQLTHFKI